MFAEQGCTMVFCSVRCREAAWSRFHFAGCQGRMTEEQKKAYNKFIKHNWEHKGVNYSDTVFLAFRFLCMTITNIRLHKKPLGIAYKSVSQLIKAPLSLFQFSYLLSDDAPNDQDEEVQLRKRWELFQKLREQSVPSQGDDATEEFLSFGIELVDKILQFTEEERSCFTSSTWSELLGAVLLNGQERSPPSNYDYLKEVVRGMPGGLAAMNAFEEQVQEAGVDPQQLHYSSRGQGIYTIGCLFNHSCEPNLQVLYSCVNDETLTVEAIRDIEPGEELLISYIDESLPYPDRQQQLYEHYLFTCRCPKCESESHDWERVATKIGDHSPSISSTL
ncbi:SET domain [Trypanosoma melophagium]|uniref:SET domain n=1 Tax=Trypanosoma melophagium TaxID=715481 RepID=UPI00351A252C|nr:SET domain [Trypanosoma melophagium]